MNPTKKCVLTINGGSSSIKFALYEVGESLSRLLYGELERIGMKNAAFNYHNAVTDQKGSFGIEAADRDAAANFLTNWLEKQEGVINAIGHRIVQGFKHSAPELVSPALMDDLRKISVYDPDHLPDEIKLIEAFGKLYPSLPQVACFDTAFHTTMPAVAKMLPIPRSFAAKGVQRYGFHGLSYAYLMEELQHVAGDEPAKGKIILAHLGSGASLVAVKDGKSVDTSMGFTPTSGLPMGTRTGDLDPGVALYLMRTEKLNPDQFSDLINHQSGLLGVSETTSDMQELMKIKDADSRAAEAIELFCYQAKKWIGSFAVVLEGLDTLVFTGGIGENSAEVRGQICRGLQFLGVELDENKNLNNGPVISAGTSEVTIRVIKTNEELMIAKMVCRVLKYPVKN